MKTLPVEQIRINLVDLLLERVEEESEHITGQELLEAFILRYVLQIYRTDLVRLRDRLPIDKQHFERLKAAAIGADELVCELRVKHPDDLKGWHRGNTPRNNVQHVMNIMQNIFWDFWRSINHYAIRETIN